jgi:hypothetical protein
MIAMLTADPAPIFGVTTGGAFRRSSRTFVLTQ